MSGAEYLRCMEFFEEALLISGQSERGSGAWLRKRTRRLMFCAAAVGKNCSQTSSSVSAGGAVRSGS